jgi:DNA replication protein DnaC
MPNLIIEVTPEKLAELLRELPAEQLKAVLAKVADRVEAREWMQLCEPGFQEWLSEPDLYSDDTPAR